ncbi:L,D-transpeptidase family protein [Brachyspira murdochii]|uniref:ErfK/YbiS/YcfS/YnhG family protein n=1 Tax=Brachyspira murdochii (strain ATCC 51284 / DSM 12563 / 56-150) TaxID=526224 RepID=D5U5Y5_BRAM5|nr:L,D-transpeptidase family protein [Brachyspira murdochii]ADG70476.1 ErfK/YbiS/YcfS/YnhG family protein [Brachyspira murdochii DSM 12563]
MKKIIICTIAIFNIISSVSFADSFLDEQKRYARVRTAIKEKDALIKQNIINNNIKLNEMSILITAYKQEDILEIYAKNKNDKTYKKIAEYKIAAKSGILGPKRMEGDLQVPEGFYYIDRFNPASSYYLSLGINYPNEADRKKSNAKRLGGDIFIHGANVTIGCMPMTDDKIKEIYLYAIYAKDNGQNKIPVYIFPFKMTDDNFNYYKEIYESSLIDFWKNIKEGYDIFQNTKKEINIKIDNNGNYIF